MDHGHGIYYKWIYPDALEACVFWPCKKHEIPCQLDCPLEAGNGTVNIWNKLERPQVYLEEGHVKYFTFAAIDVDKDHDLGNDNHSSKIIRR